MNAQKGNKGTNQRANWGSSLAGESSVCVAITLAGFLGFEPRFVKSKVRFTAEIRHLGKAALPEGSAGRVPA
jgi:hypothetical protein